MLLSAMRDELSKIAVSGLWLQDRVLGALRRGTLTPERLSRFVQRRHEAAGRLGKKVPRPSPGAGPLQGLDKPTPPALKRMWDNETVAAYADPKGKVLESIVASGKL